MNTDTKTIVQQADILDQAEAKLPAVRQPRARTVAAPMQAQPTTPMDLLRIVTERGASVEEISAFMDLMERQQKNEARQAFVLAMAAFKKTAPSIYKNEGASFTAKGQQVEYDYATLGNVCEQIIAGLAEHGISHDWTLDQPSAAGVHITCTLTHEKGHSKSTTVKLPLDTTGSKNAIQSIGSTITYGERYSLLAVCGIAVKSQGDDDGHGAGAAAAELRELAAGMKKPSAAAPAKHPIDAPTLKRALAAIKAEDYTYDELVAYYGLTPEQDAHARRELSMGAAQ